MQYASFAFSVISVVVSLFIIRHRKCWTGLGVFLLFMGLLGTAFYAEVLFFDAGNSHYLSQLRSLLQTMCLLFFAAGLAWKNCDVP